VVVAPVVDVHKEGMGERRYADVLMGGLELNYSPHAEQCGICEGSGGWCGYRQNQTDGFTCLCDGGRTTAHGGQVHQCFSLNVVISSLNASL
jgi:hypothetical protein